MDDGVFSPPAAIHGSSEMDFDYMNKLLGDECWLETVHGSDFLHQTSSDSPFSWSPSDAFLGENIFGQLQESNQEQCLRSSCSSLDESSLREKTCAKILKPEHELVSSAGSSELSVTERLIRAIGYMKDSAEDRDVLIQIWGPRDLNGKRVLTTKNQPFIVNSSSTSLATYRSISMNFQFSAEKNSNMVEGMPGRVFLAKVPEWTPDVRFFTSDEYARVGYAQTLNVRGTIALPVFARGCQTCLGVIEVVTTAQTVRPELDSVCRALQAVDLCSTGNQITEKSKTCKQSYHGALPDILQVMKSACLTHKLPLAQTWMQCAQQGKEGCRHSTENYLHCVSTVDAACYVSDPQVQGFHHACSEHHLLRGQGVAGKAFTTNQPCFHDDITSFCKTDYPLSHHARMFGLRASVAIRLRSVHTGATDFVLEFFLPADCRQPEEQKKMLSSLSLIIQKTCTSLRVVAEDTFSSAGASASGSVGSSLEDNNTSVEESFRNNGRQGDNKRAKAEKVITLQALQRHFSGSLKDAAKSLGVCPTTLKRICRSQGIKRWPSRKMKKVGKSLEKLQRVIDSVQGNWSSFQIGTFYSNFPELASPKSKSGMTQQFSGSISPASSFSQSSSQSCSGPGHHPRTWSWNSATAAAIVKENDDAVLKQPPRSQSHVTLAGALNSASLQKTSRKELAGPRVKVTYGDDKIRIRMQSHWHFKNLQQEIVRRFNVDGSGELQLKYLDDDSEWVLLTCDDDWEECIHVCLSSPRKTIKLSLHTGTTTTSEQSLYKVHE